MLIAISTLAGCWVKSTTMKILGKRIQPVTQKRKINSKVEKENISTLQTKDSDTQLGATNYRFLICQKMRRKKTLSSKWGRRKG